jgi:hypothetical protein
MMGKSTKTRTGICSGVVALLGLGPVARARVIAGKPKVFVGRLRTSRLRSGRFSFVL